MSETEIIIYGAFASLLAGAVVYVCAAMSLRRVWFWCPRCHHFHHDGYRTNAIPLPSDTTVDGLCDECREILSTPTPTPNRPFNGTLA